MSNAIIGISDWDRTRTGLLTFADKLDTGAMPPEFDFHLDFADATQLLCELPPKRLQTLRAIKRTGPVSIYTMAKALGRNYSNVHTDVHKLIEHSLVERDPDGLVRVPLDDIVVRVDASLLAAA